MAPPAAAKTASTAPAARHARNAVLGRSSGVPPVKATKIGAAEIGLMTEKREEKASSANWKASRSTVMGRSLWSKWARAATPRRRTSSFLRAPGEFARMPSPHGIPPDPRRPPAQSPEHLLRHPAQSARRRDRRIGLGQVLAGLRHDLRGRAAAVRGVAFRVRASVSRADGEARRRLDRRPFPRDLDRAAHDVEKPPLDRRNRPRDLRLSAPSLRVDRQAALSEMRPADPGADRAGNGGPRASTSRGQPVRRARAVRFGQERRVQEADGGDAQGGLPPRAHRRRLRGARRPTRARQAEEAHDRGRGGPPRREEGGRYGVPEAAGGLDRDGDAGLRRAGYPLRRGRAGGSPLRQLRLPGLRHGADGDYAAPL